MIKFNEQQQNFLEENVYKQLDITEISKENAEAVLDYLFDNFEVPYSLDIVEHDDKESKFKLAFLDTITNELMRLLGLL